MLEGETGPEGDNMTDKLRRQAGGRQERGKGKAESRIKSKKFHLKAIKSEQWEKRDAGQGEYPGNDQVSPGGGGEKKQGRT